MPSQGLCRFHGTIEEIYSRGLCQPAYETAHRHGILDRYPRIRPCASIEDFEQLIRQGLPWAEIASRLGYANGSSAQVAYIVKARGQGRQPIPMRRQPPLSDRERELLQMYREAAAPPAPAPAPVAGTGEVARDA